MQFIKSDPSFRKGPIYIPELDVIARLGSNEYYKQEFHRTVQMGVEATMAPYGGNRLLFDGSELGHSGVLTMTAEGLSGTLIEKGYFQIIKEGMDPLNELNNVGHENDHFLFNLRRTDLIYSQLKIENQGLDTEDFATLCQYLALHRGGWDITNVYPVGEVVDQQNRVRLILIDILKLDNRKPYSQS